MGDLLKLLWPAVEAVTPVFSRAAIVRWPEGAHTKLAAAELIFPNGNSGRIRCPECGQDHTATPIARPQPDGSTRIFISCPEHGRADITHADRRGWAVNIQKLVELIAFQMKLTGEPKDLSGGRVWRCGRTKMADKSHDVLLARGLCREDAEKLRRTITSAHHPFVLVGAETPRQEFWSGQVPKLVRLCDVATFDGQNFLLDTKHILSIMTDHSATNLILGTSVSEKQLTKIIRKEVTVTRRTELNDDFFIQAYLKTHSLRDAAKFLSEETGKKVTKDQVKRAIDRCGGPAAVINAKSSNSVVRPVASQHRDKHGNSLATSQPSDTEEVT